MPFTSTQISSEKTQSQLTIKLSATQGDYAGFNIEQPTRLDILTDRYPGRVSLQINQQSVPLAEHPTLTRFEQSESGIYYNPEFSPVPDFLAFGAPKQPALQIKLAPCDLTTANIQIQIQNFSYGNQIQNHAIIDSAMRLPQKVGIRSEDNSAHSFTVTWLKMPDSHVQIELNGLVYTNISGDHFTFHALKSKTKYQLRIRSQYGNKVSDWSDYFSTKTKPNQLTYAIAPVQIQSTLASDDDQPLSHLTDFIEASSWLTQQKADPQNGHFLELTFTFDQVERLSRMVYQPRPISAAGRFLQVQLAISTTDNTFSDFGPVYTWHNDVKNKVIGLRDVAAKAIKLRVLDSVDQLGAAQAILFFKAKTSEN